MSARVRALWALGAVCFFWGTTYIAIKAGVREMPPLLFSGVRFFIAGLLLSAFCLATGRSFPGPRDRGPLAFASLLMMCVANGTLAWALERVPSGVASLLVALTPLWLVVLAGAGGERVHPRAWAGVGLGLVGMAVLLWPDLRSAELKPGFAAGAGALSLSTGVWAWSSIYQKRRPHSADPFAAVAFQKLVGGAAAMALGLAVGEGPRWAPGPVGLWSLLYLTFAGSVVGYTCYLYALKHLPTQRVAMYAYVNPLVAVALGILLGGEAADPHLLMGAPVVLLGVWLAAGAPPPEAAKAEAEAVRSAL